MRKPEIHVAVCVNNRPPGHPKGSCSQRGSQMVLQRLLDEAESRGIHDRVLVTGTTCTGPCEHGAVLIVHPGNHWYRGVGPDEAAEILEAHVGGSGPVARLAMPDDAWGG